jgi:lipid-A-disaccharide synthase
MTDAQALRVYLVAGEASGDQLGAKLMPALRARLGDARVRFMGVGGERMQAEGLQSLFPLADISVMGLTAVIPRLPTLVRRVYDTVADIAATKPDVLVIIDSPDFTHSVAKRARRRLPTLPVVDYVSPSVWAWRPGRARRMRRYVDHVLALLPFEPEAHCRLGGPACTYVGHPLIERLSALRPAVGERPPLGAAEATTLLVLPGSRRSEITRLMPPFGEVVAQVSSAQAAAGAGPLRLILPAVAHLRAEIEAAAATWPVKPEIVLGEEAKHAAFRAGHAALAASGTVTLELALAGVPMVVAYRVSKIEEWLMPIVSVPSFVLPNLVLGNNAMPEFIQRDCTPERLTAALSPLLRPSAERQAQLDALRRLDSLMTIGEDSPSERAARIVVEVVGRASGKEGIASG